MTVKQRKDQLKKLIDAEKDPVVLEQVARVLQRVPKVRQSAMVKRALKAEEDHKAGRYQTLDAFSKEMDAVIDGLYERKPKAKRRA